MRLLPEYKPKKMPDYIPYDIGGMQKEAVAADKGYYNRSDRNYAQRHPLMVDAENLFEQSAAADQRGDTTLMPQIQSEFVNAGLLGSLEAFGDTPGTLAPGTAGEANVAKNLGLSVMGFQDRNRANRDNSLRIAEELFPRRTFGFSGESASLLNMLNTFGKNQENQARFANDTMADQFNYRIDAANANAQTQAENNAAQAEAAKKAAMWKAISGGVQTLTSTATSFCWVARAVYGEENPRWQEFRAWLLTVPPDSLVEYYKRHGEAIAREIEGNPRLRSMFRTAMDSII